MNPDWKVFNDQIKHLVIEGIDCRELMRQQGLVTRPSTSARIKARCPSPSHEDRTPSCSVSKESFYCFGCEARGDVFNLIGMFHGIDVFYEQIAWGCAQIGEDYNALRDQWLVSQSQGKAWTPSAIEGGRAVSSKTVIPIKPVGRTIQREPTSSPIWTQMVKGLCLDGAASRYLQARGISAQLAASHGVVSSTWEQWDARAIQVTREFGEEAMGHAGLRSKSGITHPYLDHMLVFVYHNGQEVEGLRFRTLEDPATRYDGVRYLACVGGRNDVRVPWGADFEGKPLYPTHHTILYVVEGQLDALVLQGMGRCGIATGGARKWRTSWANGWNDFEHVVVCSDAGDAGRAMEQAIVQSCREIHGEDWVRHRLHLEQVSAPGCTDVNDLLQAMFLEAHLLHLEMCIQT